MFSHTEELYVLIWSCWISRHSVLTLFRCTGNWSGFKSLYLIFQLRKATRCPLLLGATLALSSDVFDGLCCWCLRVLMKEPLNTAIDTSDTSISIFDDRIVILKQFFEIWRNPQSPSPTIVRNIWLVWLMGDCHHARETWKYWCSISGGGTNADIILTPMSGQWSWSIAMARMD